MKKIIVSLFLLICLQSISFAQKDSLSSTLYAEPDFKGFQIDASSSYDRDAKYGGAISNYEFTITPNYRVTTNQSVINYIFPKVGNYQIALRVQDNDSVWSASKVAWVNVQ